MIDERICQYYQLHGMAQNMVDSTGRVYDKACSKCGFVICHWKATEMKWVCGHCGADWEYSDVEVLKGEVCRASRNGKPIPAPRAGEYENNLAGLADLGYHLNAMLRDEYWKWPTQILVAHAITSCSYEEIAEHANEYGWLTRRGGDWTEPGARLAAVRARRELVSRLNSPPVCTSG